MAMIVKKLENNYFRFSQAKWLAVKIDLVQQWLFLVNDQWQAVIVSAGKGSWSSIPLGGINW